VAITYQDGLVFHAAVVIVAPNTAAAVGVCVAVNTASLRLTVCQSSSDSAWGHASEAFSIGRTRRQA